MDKNIFIRNKKYNPDVATNYSKKMNERNNVKYTFKEDFINKNNVTDNPEVYKVDKEISDIDLLIQKKLDERQKEEFDFKPQKNFVPSANPNDFKEYNDLKTQQTKYETKNKKESDNFNDIMGDLQSLGILKK